jgi:hypothetical protein
LDVEVELRLKRLDKGWLIRVFGKDVWGRGLFVRVVEGTWG